MPPAFPSSLGAQMRELAVSRLICSGQTDPYVPAAEAFPPANYVAGSNQSAHPKPDRSIHLAHHARIQTQKQDCDELSENPHPTRPPGLKSGPKSPETAPTPA